MKTQFIIYKIYWPSRAFYYGKTGGYRERHNRHLREMKDGTHHNKCLVNMYAKYGEPKFKICAYATSDEELAVMEHQFLSFHRNNRRCLNVCFNVINYRKPNRPQKREPI